MLREQQLIMEEQAKEVLVMYRIYNEDGELIEEGEGEKKDRRKERRKERQEKRIDNAESLEDIKKILKDLL